ncbi:MAG: hypothetical protein AAF192_10720, partial [Pseudomonadota bacterium]
AEETACTCTSCCGKGIDMPSASAAAIYGGVTAPPPAPSDAPRTSIARAAAAGDEGHDAGGDEDRE